MYEKTATISCILHFFCINWIISLGIVDRTKTRSVFLDTSLYPDESVFFREFYRTFQNPTANHYGKSPLNKSHKNPSDAIADSFYQCL